MDGEQNIKTEIVENTEENPSLTEEIVKEINTDKEELDLKK